MADYPWQGAAAPMPPDAFARAAEKIGCDSAAIRALWDVEASGRGYFRDGTLIRRFEPHKMPGSTMTWRDSLKIGPGRRRKMFLAAYHERPAAAMNASSWGGPQIMGFNAEDAGFPSALAMVEAMADSEQAQIDAFVTLIEAWGLATTIRAHDWLTFAGRYNGSGQARVYARKIEAAYRRHSGRASPQVLRQGDDGAAVRRLQNALGVRADGDFGPGTEEAVRTFQRQAGLKADGIAGRKTWDALTHIRGAKPKRQETGLDRAAEKVTDLATKGGIGSGVTLGAQKAVERAPDGAVDLAFYGGVGLALLVGAALAGALVLRWWRDAA